jgi:tRNA modification GTPase
VRSSTPHAPDGGPGADTIAALATPSGESAVAVVRISGPGALATAAPLVRSRAALEELESHRLTRVRLVDPRTGERIDDALCAVMRAPRSYTGEDTVEISCHGSPALARMLLGRLVDLGARLAEPGEFTRRAFLNGRLDLAQAEAVALLISARTERAVALAARGMAGDLSRRVRAFRESLVGAMASLEVALDFPDEVPEPDQTGNTNSIIELASHADAMVSAARRGLAVHAGLTMAIVGAPNAGKSSLFNALLGRERAIVTPEAGTTRDVLDATMVIGGVPVCLLDTAGLGTPRDPIDAEAMARSRRAMEESDLLIHVIDGSIPLGADAGIEPGNLARICDDPEGGRTSAGKPRLVVLAKSDLGLHPTAACVEGAVPATVKGEGGLDAVHQMLQREVRERSCEGAAGDAVIASLRQVELLEAMAGGARRASEALKANPIEIALIELRGALDAASDLLGIQTGEAVLDAIFSRFCVGK